LNNDDSTTKSTNKNGVFFFEVMCPSIDTEKTIQIRAKVSRLPETSSFLIPNTRTLSYNDIWYEDNGRLFDPSTEFGATKQSDLQKSIYSTVLSDTSLGLPNAVVNMNSDKITLKNTSLEIDSQQSVIAKDTTLISSTDQAAILIPKDTALASSQIGKLTESAYIGTFIAPTKVNLTDTPAVNLAQKIAGSGNVEQVYKFGSDTLDKTLYARKDTVA
jgi:hypothetical protein